MKIEPNVGQALFPKMDLMRLSKNVNRFGTQMPNASITMMRSRSNLDYNPTTQCLVLSWHHTIKDVNETGIWQEREREQ